MEEVHAGSVPRSAMIQRVMNRVHAKGEIVVPAVPGLLDDYVSLCGDIFARLGVMFSSNELAQLRSAIEGQLVEGFSGSPRSHVVINYEAPIGRALDYRIVARWFTVEEAYEDWIATREPPLFGTEPDARVMALAAEAGDPADCAVLDIGAGTGRNSLALARRGHRVDAIEMTGKFAQVIADEAARAGLDVRVLRRDAFETHDDLRTDYGLILLSEVVSDFRNTDQLRRLFELAAHCLAPGGDLLFNVFLPRDGYAPDDAARQFGQQCYTSIFTRGEFAAAAAGLPLHLVADDSVYDYERTHQAPESWPPTSWYCRWVNGQDVFEGSEEDSPIEMRWLVYRKLG